MHRSLASLALLNLSLPLPLAVAQEGLTVTIPTDFPTIQAGIDAVSDGAVVKVLPGVYEERIDFLGKSIWVDGSGAAGTIVDVTNAPEFMDPPYRPAVRFINGELPGSRLRGFTIRGASPAGNPCGQNQSTGIYAPDAAPYIEDCIIEDNHGCFGGGAYINNGVLERCILRNNTSADAGGGLWTESAILSQCTIVSNQTVNGEAGGVYATGNAALQHCQILDNSTGFDGYSGGGISGPASLLNCVIAGNTANTFGGMIGASGGGVFGAELVAFCTVTDNANGPCLFGDCGFAVSATTEVYCSIITGNDSQEVSPGTLVTYSTVTVPGGYPGTGNLEGDPQFVDPGSGIYTLMATSPALDAGDPGYFFPDPDGSIPDQGAYPVQVLSSLNLIQELQPEFGGFQALAVNFGPSAAGDVVWILGTLGDSLPGVVVGGVTVPLTPDTYTLSVLAAPASSPILGGLQVLSPMGTAIASFELTPGAALSVAGETATHCALRFDPATGALLEASNPLPVKLGS